jgi:hypothetical protein
MAGHRDYVLRRSLHHRDWHGPVRPVGDGEKVSTPTGVGKIINVDAQVTHIGPLLSPGQTFTVAFNRDVKNGDLICDQVGNSSAPCVMVHP